MIDRGFTYCIPPYMIRSNVVTGVKTVNAEWLNEAMREMYGEYKDLKAKG